MSRILVVGSRGYLGPHVCSLLKESGHDVVEVDAGFWGQPLGTAICKDASTEEFRRWAVELGPDAVVYLGAIAHDPEGKIDEDLHCRHTAEAPQELAGRLPDTPFIFASSLSVFDRAGNDASKHSSVYPACKRGAEAGLFTWGRNASILRFGTLYGPGVTPEYYRPHLLLNRMVYTALKHGKVEVFNPKARRPVLSVERAAAIIKERTTRGLCGVPGRTAENHYDVSGTVLAFGARVAELTSTNVELSGTSPDTRDYGNWPSGGPEDIDLIPLLDWTRAHLSEIDLTRRQVIP